MRRMAAVDRETRDALAERLEAFLADGIEGGQLAADGHAICMALYAPEEQRVQGTVPIYRSGERPDPAPKAVRTRLTEYHTDANRHFDAPGRALYGSELPDDRWNEFVRCILFLRSDRELGWPEQMWDPLDEMGSGPGLGKVLAAMIGGGGVIVSLGGLVSGQWGETGILLALTAAAVWGTLRIARRYGQTHSEREDVVDTVFPFANRDELDEEIRRQRPRCGLR